MSAISNNDIARTFYLLLKDKHGKEQAEISKRIVQFLFRKRLLAKSADILTRLQSMINKEEGVISAKVWSVERLSGATKTHLTQILKKRYGGKHVVLEEILDKELVGGLKIEVNNELIDLSIKNKIAKLQEHLTKTG